MAMNWCKYKISIRIFTFLHMFFGFVFEFESEVDRFKIN